LVLPLVLFKILSRRQRREAEGSLLWRGSKITMSAQSNNAAPWSLGSGSDLVVMIGQSWVVSTIKRTMPSRLASGSSQTDDLFGCRSEYEYGLLAQSDDDDLNESENDDENRSEREWQQREESTAGTEATPVRPCASVDTGDVPFIPCSSCQSLYDDGLGQGSVVGRTDAVVMAIDSDLIGGTRSGHCHHIASARGPSVLTSASTLAIAAADVAARDKNRSSMPTNVDSAIHGHNYTVSALSRPRTLLLTSLLLWTALMASSSMLGLNTLPVDNSDISLPLRQGGFVLPSDGDNLLLGSGPAFLEDSLLDRDAISTPLASARVGILIISDDTLSSTQESLEDEMAAALEAFDAIQEDPETSEDEDAPIEILDREDFEAMTADPEDAWMFQQFLQGLEEDEAATTMIQQPKSTLEASKQPEEILRATNKFMVELWQANERVHVSGQAFEYRGVWTDLMILAIATCLGGVLLGLAQAHVLVQQLIQAHEQSHGFGPSTLQRRQGRVSSLITALSCGFLVLAALSLTFVMILTECWDVPSTYFMGMGISGAILVHTWIPDAALHLSPLVPEIGAVRNEMSEKSLPSSDSYMAERRNACSLDETRRWPLDVKN
ncbi:hypothetical protein BGW38_005281, partial [Lunasporangiospora selenospora]